MEDTTEANTKVLSGELFFGVVALQMPIQKYHYMHDLSQVQSHFILANNVASND